MNSNKYLIVVYTVTAGQHYEELGSDEQEIVLFAWLVLDIINLKIIDVKCNYVKPKYCEKLSETAKTEFQLSEQLIEENGQYLDSILEEFNLYVRNKLNYDNGEQFVLVTDGQQHLRQVLHPECTSKHINLPDYFYRFFDLKKEFRKFLRDNMTDSSSSTLNSSSELLERSSTSSIDYQLNDAFSNQQYKETQTLHNSTSSSEFDQLMGDSPLKINTIFPNLLAPTIIQKFSIHQMLKELSLEPDNSAEVVVQAIKNMANIILNLISNGHTFDEAETINLRFEPGICSRNEIVDNMTVVRARGLPWQSSDQDVARFFKGLNIHKGGVALCLSTQGRRNGEALIRFACVEHRELALKRHKHHINQRYIEVYRAKGEDFINVAGGSNNEAQQFLQKGGQVIVRMRGLPYLTTAEQVVEFFANPNSVTESVNKVECGTTVAKQKATSTDDESMETVVDKQDKNDLNNNIEPKDEQSDKVTSSKRPYCQVMHGIDGVLFVRRKDNRASGDAFCLFENEQQGQLALSKHRQLIGSRYIELFRSSTAEVQQVFNRTMDSASVAIKNGFEQQNQLTTTNTKATPYPTTSFLPIHHQSHNSIYQTANHTALVNNTALVNPHQTTAQPTSTHQPIIQNAPSNLTATGNHMQPPTLQATIQPALLAHHLHHPNSLNSLNNYPGHSSFHQPPIHHHPNQLTSHAQHSHATGNNTTTGNLAHYQNQCFNHAKQHTGNLAANSITNGHSTCTLTKPHSVCTSPATTSSPASSLDASSNGNHQLITSNKTTTSTSPKMASRPLRCVQTTAQQTATYPTQLPANFNSLRKDCIRLRGLPYEANYEEILVFLGEFSNQISYQGIHMIYNISGQPTGEAFVQMQTEFAASQAALAKHHKYMVFGKKYRYIEVFQCSLDDMSMLLNSGHFVNGPNSNLLNGQIQMQHTLNANMMPAPTHYYHLTQNHLLSSSRTHYFPVLYHSFNHILQFPSPPISPIYSSQATMPIY